MIEDITELNFPKTDGKQYATLTQATVTLQDMAEKTITAQIRVDGQITPDFSYDWEVEFKGEKYIMPLRQPQGAKDNTSMLSTIDLTFQHWAIYQLKRWYFFTVQPVESGTAVPDKYIASVSLNLKDFCALFNKVLGHYFNGKITLDFNDPDTHENGWEYAQEPTAVEISHSYIWDVLIKLYDLFAVRWQIEPNGDLDHYVIKVGYPTTEVSHIFEYGFEGGLLKVERQVQDENIRNMILGRGGDKNLPYRYFKKHDNDNKSFSPDPDWIPELSNRYFSELHGATFRSYIQGWKAAHADKYRGYASNTEAYKEKYGQEYPVGEEWSVSVDSADKAYAPWAWMRGYTDDKFNPVEFVADGFNVEEYGHGVVPDSSIAKYGELLGGLDNNEDIYPTIQGVVIDGLGRIDEVVAVEPIQSDDVNEAAKAQSEILDIEPATTTRRMAPEDLMDITLIFPKFTVPDGQTANLGPGEVTLSAEYANILPSGRPSGVRLKTDAVVLESAPLITVYNAVSGESRSAVGIPPGEWYWAAEFRVRTALLNHPMTIMFVTVGYETPKLTISDITNKGWSNVWNIWVKDLWGVSREDGETDEQYADRVWRSILGDRAGGEAKVVFSSGWLSTSEDYEFVIADIPKYDTSRIITHKDKGGNVIASYPSRWRITLGKSDADLESTGLYVPSTMRQAEAGDHFFFIGIDMPHLYVKWAEVRLDDWKKDHLREVSEIKPTWVVGLDKVRIGNGGRPDALIDQLQVGNTITLFDQRFIPGSAQEKLYLQSITYTYNEPTDTEANILPDVEVVLSDKYEVSANPVATLSGEVSAIQRQLGFISNIEQIVRLVGDELYMRKDGMPDRSMSPTEFASLLTSLDFRSGIVGGHGWGFYRDEDGNWVLETDRIKARQDFEVNNLVANQVSAVGGMEIYSAASMVVSHVLRDPVSKDYVCFFDQKAGTVANLFIPGDIAYSQEFDAYNGSVRFYKRVVNQVDDDFIVLASDGDGVNGDGEPMAGDVIAQYGNINTPSRQYVKIRDVIGGGYERYLEGLDSVTATGIEYYFVGRQSGQFNGRPRFFIGDKGSYVEYVNGELKIKGRLDMQSTVDDSGTTLGEALSTQRYTLDLSNEVAGVPCDADGNVIGDYPWTQATVWDGAEKVTFGVKYSIAAITPINSIFAGITETGSVFFAALTADSATVTIQAEVGGVVLQSSINLYKVKPGAQGEPAVVYSIEPSVSNVTRAMDGTLSVDTITVTKYKTTGSEQRQQTIEKHVLYRYYYEDGTFYENVLSLNNASPSGSIAIPGRCTAIEFSMYDADGSLLDKERVPILTDAAALSYLSKALKESTTVEGGLVQTSLIELGYTDDNGERHTKSGSSGIYNSDAIGGGISFWSGGRMLDRMDYYRWDQRLREWVTDAGESLPVDIAKGVDRMDGSGYRGDGAIMWDKDGTYFNGPIYARGGFIGMMEQYRFELTEQNFQKFCIYENIQPSTIMRVYPDWFSVGALLCVRGIPAWLLSGITDVVIDLPDFNRIWRGGFNTARQFYGKAITVYNELGRTITLRYAVGGTSIENMATITLNNGYCASLVGKMAPTTYNNAKIEFLAWEKSGDPCMSFERAFPE